MENFASVNASLMDGAKPKTSDYQYVMVKNERTAGSIPAYARQNDFDSVLSSFAPMQQGEQPISVSKEDRFGIFDLIDMINPLQHIPLLNIAYQRLTGDTIKPISRIIGGTVFGGPAGAATGLMTSVIQDGTGKSLLENAKTGFARSTPDHTRTADIQAYNDLPPSVMAFAEVPPVNDQNYDYNT
tara:strand:- start:25908 stop:26462 length:555 start_codon:yes stop_codon:yes gene_type:complete